MSRNFKDFEELKTILKTLDYNLTDQELENIGIMLKINTNNYEFVRYPLIENKVKLLFNIILDLYGVEFMQKRILKCSQGSYYNLYNYFITGNNKPTHVYKQLEMFYNIIMSYFIGDKDES